MLHGVGPTPQELDALHRKLTKKGKSEGDADAKIDARLPVRTDDALRDLGSTRYNVILTNPPFGKKSSVMVVTDEGGTDREKITYERDDFWTSTTNKQLNLVQHVKSLLDIHGRAAVVVPDNVLFEGGAGETIPSRAAQGVRVPHAPAASHRDLLRPGRQGERPLLRPQAGGQGRVDPQAVGL